MRVVCLSIFPALLLFLFGGCGRSEKNYEIAPVTGTVTYRGKPLEQGTIIFEPQEGPRAIGKIVKGTITEVTTKTPGDGAVIGSHKVMIQSVQGDEKDMYATKTSLIPERYASPTKSGLTATIKSGTNEVKFELKD